MVKKNILENICKMAFARRESSKNNNYLAQRANPNPWLQYKESLDMF